MSVHLRPWAVLLLAASQANAQEIQVVSEPLVANERGELVPASVSGARPLGPSSIQNPVKLETVGSSRSLLKSLFDECPGLVNCFMHLERLDGFRWRMAPEHQTAVLNVVHDAIARRQGLLAQAENIQPKNLLGSVRLIEKAFDSEAMADERLSELLIEIVTPEESPHYFAVERRFERGLLTSRYFSELAGVSKDDSQRRLNAAREFAKWHVRATFEGKRDLKHAEHLLRAIYQDLTVGQFLQLKVQMGQARPDGDLTDYLTRTKNLKFNTASYVSAVAEEVATGERTK